MTIPNEGTRPDKSLSVCSTSENRGSKTAILPVSGVLDN